MFWFQLVVVLLLLAAVGWLAVGGGGHMSEPVPDRADLALPDDRLVAARDLDQVRFSVGLRGYRMEEVDDVLDRLAREVESRDRRIAELEGRPYSSPYSGDGFGPGTAAEGEDTGEAGPGPDSAAVGEGAAEASAPGEENEPGGEESGESEVSAASAQYPSEPSATASAAFPESAAGEPRSPSDLPPLP